jgi:hypothetical protein
MDRTIVDLAPLSATAGNPKVTTQKRLRRYTGGA